MKRWTWIVLVVLMAMVLSSCASARTSESYPGAEPEMREEGGKAMDNYESAPMEPMPASTMDGGSYAEQPQAAAQGVTVERMVIRNADMAIIVDDPEVAMNQIMAMASRLGGFVVSSNLYKVQYSQVLEVPEVNITVRVPAEQLDAAMEEILGLTTNPKEDVTRQNVSGQDVTQEYTDLSSRLKNLEEAEAQLRAIMADANRTEDVLSVFNQLTQIRGEIEVIKGQMKYYEQSAAMSAISVYIQARASIAPITVAGWTPKGVARDAVQALVEAGQFLASAAIWVVLFVLPVLLIIAIPILIVFLIARAILRGRRRKMVTTPAE